MSLYFEELEYRQTPIGALSLRRRRELRLGVDVFEIKLGDEFLMSSLFTESEIALARLGLAQLPGQGLDVVIGGLGLGYTAKAVPTVTSSRPRRTIAPRTRPPSTSSRSTGASPRCGSVGGRAPDRR